MFIAIFISMIIVMIMLQGPKRRPATPARFSCQGTWLTRCNMI